MSTRTPSAATVASATKSAADAPAKPASNKKGKDPAKAAAAFLAKYGYTVDDENKAQRFKRVGNKRLKKAVAALKGLTKLAGSSYSYDEKQREHILATLVKHVDAVKVALAKTGGSDGEDFGL